MHVATKIKPEAEGRKKASEESTVRSRRDETLVADYRNGRKAAFEELMNSYDGMIRKHLQQLSGTTDIEDLKQEVFLKIFRNMHKFKGESYFYTWMYRITLNVFFDSAKKRRRADGRLEKLQNDFVDASVVRRDIEDPYHAYFEQMTQDLLAEAIQELPKIFSEVMAMRELEGLSYEEISDRVGVSTGTVRSRLSRARTRLRTALAPRIGRMIAA